MSTTKRCISLLLAALMVLGFILASALATSANALPRETTFLVDPLASEPKSVEPMGTTVDGLEYDVYSDHVEITGYSGSTAEVVIPAKIEGLPVTSIGNSAFTSCFALTSISIPDSVTCIGNRSFFGCSSLTSIHVDDNNPSFSNDDRGALFDKWKTQLIQVPATLWGSYTIPEGVNSIDSYAFADCDMLTSISIPDSVSYIGDRAFIYCKKLTSISIPDGVTSIGDSTFYCCRSLINITIPVSVTHIGDGAFYLCDSLTSITIPDSVTFIGVDAFHGCDGLTSISIPAGITHINDNTFSFCDSLTSIYIPDSVTSIGYGAFSWCSNLSSISIPAGVTTIGDAAFYGCSSLTSIYIPKGVTAIGNSTFSQCTNLSSIAIPDGVTKIGHYAFASCESLTDITIPDGVTFIGECAFEFCNSLTSITIPSSVTILIDGALSRCSNLTSIYFKGDAPEFDLEHMGGVFYNVTATAYYPAGNPTWTADVLQDHGGTITWVPYNPNGGEIPSPSVDTHDTISELTNLDFLAFSKICYEDFEGRTGDTLKAVLNDKGIWNTKFEKTDVKYSELCASIANWRIAEVCDLSNISGFYGVAFENGNGEAVIAFRGSVPLHGLDDLTSLDGTYDWILNDLPAELFNTVLEDGQYLDAISMYKNMVTYYPTIAVTGHSLGGGLADIVSAHFGCKGVSMNAISILDAVYSKAPALFAESFEGVDKWQFHDHANEHDVIAGSFENILATKIKPVIAHHDNNGGFNIMKIFDYHGLGSFVTRDSDGNVQLQSEAYRFFPQSVITACIGITRGVMGTMNGLEYIDFGTSKNNSINKGLSIIASRVSYGGNGADALTTSIRGDILIGGNGNDSLDGNRGNDTYYYYKGNGMDTVHDIGGNDVLYLLGFGEDDTLSISEDSENDYIHVVSNGDTIVKISKKNREYSVFTLNSFKIIVDDGIKWHDPVVFDITDSFKKTVYGQRILVACPVNIEIIDPNGNVVFTLADREVGNWYTDYGNFYVFEEENGEYGKVLDLIEGYTVRIVGAGEGTMDVTYQVPVEGELTDPVSVSGVPVTEELTATIEETENGDVYLVIDENGDGETDSERKLYGECPFNDVDPGSFYYEPVMWAIENGITNGTSATTFGPNDQCMRAHVVTFLWRAVGSPEPTRTDNPFVDVKPSDFYYKPVLWALENEITSGMDATHFGPTSYCNRAQVVTFLYRTMGSPELDSAENPFTDVAKGSFYEKPVLWAVQNGITNGLSATAFGPNAICNRAQIVTFLYRAFVKN